MGGSNPNRNIKYLFGCSRMKDVIPGKKHQQPYGAVFSHVFRDSKNFGSGMALQHPTTALLGHQHDEDVRMTACPYVLRGLHAIQRTSMLEAQHIDQSMPYKAYENQLLYYGLSILELHI